MKFLKSKDAVTGDEISLSYKDYGKGQPIVLIHGWPLSKEMWEYQIDDLMNAGFRVIKYDRRGFGKSDKPWDSYDYDVLADDLKAIIDGLDLRKAVLVGFSMGGGEVVRYLTKHGSDRIDKIVLISSVTPYLLKTHDNPDGVDETVFADMMREMKEDRIAFLDDFGKKFFSASLMNHPVSTPLLEYYRMLASLALPRATQQCAVSFSHTDFRNYLAGIDLPTLIIHGDDDKTVPIGVSGERTALAIRNSRFIIYEGAPHGLFYTHRKRLNSDLIQFISQPSSVPQTFVNSTGNQ